jgi:hypothetical protein
MPVRPQADSTQFSTRADSLLADEKAFLLILTPDEKSEFQKLFSPAAKTRWRQIYWKRRDPTATTEKMSCKKIFSARWSMPASGMGRRLTNCNRSGKFKRKNFLQ